MILNDHQYKVSKEAAAKFRAVLAGSTQRARPAVESRLAQAETAALRSQLEDIEQEIAEYESRPDAFRDFDPARMVRDLAASGSDIERLSQLHVRNVEALQTAHQLAATGFQTIAARQTEIMKEAMEQISSAVREMLGQRSAARNVGKQPELAQQVMEKAVGNMRELTELATKAQSEAFDVLARRWMASLEEACDVFAKRNTSSDDEINKIAGKQA